MARQAQEESPCLEGQAGVSVRGGKKEKEVTQRSAEIAGKKRDRLNDMVCGFWLYLKIEARYPSGKGEVCKTFMREFDSHPRLQDLCYAMK